MALRLLVFLFLASFFISVSNANFFYWDLDLKHISCLPYYTRSIVAARYQADAFPGHIVELGLSVDKDCKINEKDPRGAAFLFRRLWNGSCAPVAGIVAKKAEISFIEVNERDLTISIPYFDYLLKAVAKSEDFNFEHDVKISISKGEDGKCIAQNERIITYKGRDYPVEIRDLHASYEESETDEETNDKLPLGIRIAGRRIDTDEDFILWLGDHPGAYHVSFFVVKDFLNVGVNVGLE